MLSSDDLELLEIIKIFIKNDYPDQHSKILSSDDLELLEAIRVFIKFDYPDQLWFDHNNVLVLNWEDNENDIIRAYGFEGSSNLVHEIKKEFPEFFV